MNHRKDALVDRDENRAWMAARDGLAAEDLHKQCVEHYLKGRLTIEEAARLMAAVNREELTDSLMGEEAV